MIRASVWEPVERYPGRLGKPGVPIIVDAINGSGTTLFSGLQKLLVVGW